MFRSAFKYLGRLRSTLFLYKLLTGAAFVAAISAAWTYLQSAPWPVVGLVSIGVMGIASTLLIGIAYYLNNPPTEGIYSPRSLRWYKLPISKVSWDLDNYLGGSSRQGSPIFISSFQARFKINWGDGIQPIKAYIECKKTSSHQDVLIECGNPYVEANEIDFLPRG